MAIPVELANRIVDPAAFGDGDLIDDVFRTLRRSYPLDIARPDDHDPFWVVARHADITEIERQPLIFTNGGHEVIVADKASYAALQHERRTNPDTLVSIVRQDGEEHRAMRGLLFAAMTPRAMRAQAGTIRAIAREAVDEMLARGPQVDFAGDVAFLYPLRVLMGLLGIPREDERIMLNMTQDLARNTGSRVNSAGTVVSSQQATDEFFRLLGEMEAFFDRTMARYRAAPAANLASLVVNGTVQGRPLTRGEQHGYLLVLATAGHDTTSATTAGAMWALAERPQMLAALRADPARIGDFVEESIRWVSPVKHFMRTVAQDVEVGGARMAKGDWLMLAFHSANRDEALFENPCDFILDRGPNRQIGFGHGPHVCLGQHLARLEMRIFWEELLPRLRTVELAGKPVRSRSNFISGPRHLPIRFTLT